MAKLPILRAGDPLLREKAKPVNVINKNIKKLLSDMEETMREAEGVGLAAPQVGVSKRIVVIDVGDGLLELINPVIIASEGIQVCEQEGCLSVPGYFGEVERAAKIEVKAIDRQGKEMHFFAEGYKAQAIQHEVDHLDGILFIDKAIKLIKAEAIKQEA